MGEGEVISFHPPTSGHVNGEASPWEVGVGGRSPFFPVTQVGQDACFGGQGASRSFLCSPGALLGPGLLFSLNP